MVSWFGGAYVSGINKLGIFNFGASSCGISVCEVNCVDNTVWVSLVDAYVNALMPIKVAKVPKDGFNK